MRGLIAHQSFHGLRVDAVHQLRRLLGVAVRADPEDVNLIVATRSLKRPREGSGRLGEVAHEDRGPLAAPGEAVRRNRIPFEIIRLDVAGISQCALVQLLGRRSRRILASLAGAVVIGRAAGESRDEKRDSERRDGTNTHESLQYGGCDAL